MEIRIMRETDANGAYSVMVSSLDEYYAPEVVQYFLMQWPAGTEYEWSLGDGTVRTGTLNRTLFRLPGPGTYTATVRIPGTDYSCSATYVVEGDENGYLGHMNQTYVLLAVSLLVIGIGMCLFRQRFSPPERGRMYR